MKTEHTPTPWTCHSGSIWLDRPTVYPKGEDTGIPIAKMDREPGNGTLPVERDANATFIVEAVNAHDKLVHDNAIMKKALIEIMDLAGRNGVYAEQHKQAKEIIEFTKFEMLACAAITHTERKE